jgi:catechol 2,3-dioxygenase-like lactoylglutathione lyase family enzyme
MKFLTVLLSLGLSAAAPAAEVSMGHHHLNVPDIEEATRFWKLLGAEPVTLGDLDALKLPDLVVILRESPPTGASVGTTVNHIGVQLRDVPAMVQKLEAAGYPIVTQEVLPDATGKIYFHEVQKTNLAFTTAPGGTRVELFENKSLATPIANHHIHFNASQIDEMKAWYVKTFGAVPGQRGGMEAAQLPGVNLTFSPASGSVTGTKGRALDHIGFEVDDLKAFCEHLEQAGITFDRPYTEVPRLGLSIAFFTDPWGTYIELTEGLDSL